MPSDTLTGLRQEIEEAIEVIEPQIRGLDDAMLVSLSPATKDSVQIARMAYHNRKGLLDGVIAALDALEAATAALEADGYPESPTYEVGGDVYEELQQQHEDEEAALALFELLEPASNIKVAVGAPADKPKP